MPEDTSLPDMPEDTSLPDNDVIITSSPLCVSTALSHITLPSCGGNSIFCGTTRNSFQDKAVVCLEYEAYPSMAILETRRICEVLCGEYPEIGKWYVAHRTGRVDVGEVSIIVAASSPHRAEAIEFVEKAVDRIKERVPIWKKEWYEDGSMWKENHQCGRSGKKKESGKEEGGKKEGGDLSEGGKKEGGDLSQGGNLSQGDNG